MRRKTKFSNSKPRTVGIGVDAKSRRRRLSQWHVRISLGSKETVTSIRGQVGASREPAVIAVALVGGQRHLVSIGSGALAAAQEMKDEIELIRPIVGGVVVDFEAAEWLVQAYASGDGRLVVER